MALTSNTMISFQHDFLPLTPFATIFRSPRHASCADRHHSTYAMTSSQHYHCVGTASDIDLPDIQILTSSDDDDELPTPGQPPRRFQGHQTGIQTHSRSSGTTRRGSQEASVACGGTWNSTTRNSTTRNSITTVSYPRKGILKTPGSRSSPYVVSSSRY